MKLSLLLSLLFSPCVFTSYVCQQAYVLFDGTNWCENVEKADVEALFSRHVPRFQQMFSMFFDKNNCTFYLQNCQLVKKKPGIFFMF